VGTTVGFQNLVMHTLSPTTTPLNPAMVPTISYEYLFCHPSSDQLRPPSRWKTRGLLSGFCTSGTTGRRLRPSNLDTISSHQRQNGWGTIHPEPGTTPPLLAREEGPPIQKEPDLGVGPYHSRPRWPSWCRTLAITTRGPPDRT
jgi:hypothetical protein